MSVTFRSIARYLAPSWLQGPVLDSHLAILDESIARARAGLNARFPSRAELDANELTGEDRGIPRGRDETDAHYAARLIGWRYPRGHRVRGSAFALLNQVSEYFGGIACATVDKKQNYHRRSASGVETFSYGYAWNWDADATKLARFWLIIHPGALMSAPPSLGDPPLWGGALGTPGYTIGQLGATFGDKEAITNLFQSDTEWKPSGSRPQWLIVDLDGTVQAPDSTWSRWSKNVAGTQVASRYAGWRYWCLFPGLNVYGGDASNYPTLLTKPDGATYAGDPLTYPAAFAKPDGNVYAGNAASFPATFALVDDGDLTA